jgi:hypothetical protein
MVLASFAMAAVLVAVHAGLAGWLMGGPTQRVVALATLILTGMAVFAAVAQLTGAAGLRDLRGLMRGRDAA